MKNDPQQIGAPLLAAYKSGALWGASNAAWPLPADVTRGDEAHLAFLTLVYAISGGREPDQLWDAARTTFAADPELFVPRFLAYAKGKELAGRLIAHKMARKTVSDSTTWQRTGQALVMRAGGSVRQLLANFGFDGAALLAMLQANKATFPVLSGEQTAPRWLYGLAQEGAQPLTGVERLPVPLSPAGTTALANLGLTAPTVSAAAFNAVEALAHHGCAQHPPDTPACPAAPQCPVASFCRYGTIPTPSENTFAV